MTKASRFLLSASAVIILGACSHQSPNWLPDGYYWNDDTPLSSPPKTAPWFQEAYDESAESIRRDLSATLYGLSADMVSTLTSRTSIDRPVYLYPKSETTALTTVYDDALRTNLRESGFSLANGPVGAVSMAYYASPISGYRSHNLNKNLTTMQSLGITPRDEGYLFSVSLEDSNGGIIAEEARVQPLPKKDIEHWDSNYHQYERPGPVVERPIYERD
ncbi:MAG: hypothetical protein CL565_04870 [Alphaproteobacteria bacterium]|nr:hypothetical protein [Alphaproteobacteria bacterium]